MKVEPAQFGALIGGGGGGDFLRAVLDNVEDGIVACDADGVLRYFNRATRAMHGLPEEPVPPGKWPQHYGLCRADGTTPLRPEEVPLLRALKEGAVKDAEMVIVPRGRPPRHVVASGRAIYSPDGRKLGAVVSMHEVTDRKALLRERDRVQLAQLGAVLSSVAEGIVAADPAGNVVEWNAAALSIHGFADVSAARRHLSKFPDTFELVTPDGRPIPLEEWPMSRALRGETFSRFEIRLRRLDQGWEKFMSYSGTCVRGDGGAVALAVLTIHDISERKAAEALVVQSRRQMELVVKGANVGVWYCPLPFDRLIWDAKVKEHFHLAPDADVTIETFYERLHPDDRDRTRAAIDDSIARKAAYDIEYRTVSPDGAATHWIRASGRGFYDAAGDPTRFDGITIDITPQKHAEARSRFLVALDDAMRPLTDAGELTLAAARLLGEHLGADRCAYADVEADEDTMNLVGNYRRTPEVVSIVGRLRFADFGAEVLQLMRDDEPYVVEDIDTHVPPVGDKAAYRATQIQAVVCVPLHKGGRFVAAMAVHQTVPRRWAPGEVALVRQVASRCWESIERARVARVLREADEFHRFAAEAGRTGSWYVRPDTMECVLSPMMADLMGFPPGQTTASAEQWRESVVAEDRGGIEAAMTAAIERDVPLDHEFRIVLPGGGERWLYSHGGAVRDARGRAVRLYGASVDITGRKHAEAALRASEGRYRSIVDQSVAGIAEVDRTGRFVRVNERYCAMVGYARDELVGRLRMHDLTHPDDLPGNAALLQGLLADGRPFEIEKRYVRKDGSLVWVHNSVSAVHDGAGALQGLVAVSIDIGALKAAEIRSQSILESITDGFYALDREWRFAYVNAAAERVLLRGRGELLGRNIWEEFPGAIGTSFEREYRRAMGEGVKTQFVEYYPPPLDGWYEVRAYPSADGVSCYFQDITERRRSEEALAEARQRLELAVGAGELGTFFCPMPLGEIVWNDKCKEHFFLPPEAKVDFDLFYAILHEEDRQRTREAIEQSVFARRGYDVQYRTVAPDGRFRWIRAKGRAYYDDAGNPTRFDGITIDITDLKRVEQEREQLLEGERAARAEAERASRLKDDFLTTLSHELRTPLNAILGWSQLLERGKRTPEELSEGLSAISRNARVQTQLIEDLLDMSRVMSGKLRLDVQPVNTHEVVEAAIESVAPAAVAKGIRIEQVLSTHAGPIPGDPGRLQQVVWNLLTNAIKFTPKDGRVQVVLARVNSHVEIKVSDNGVGIRPEFLPHVFERFRQADSSTTRHYGGLGIGLSLVKQLTEMHGGTVAASSGGEGKGASFTVTLPLAVATSAGAPADATDRPPSSESADLDLTGVRVLIVDDEPDAQVMARRILTDRGAEVATAGSAAEGLEAVRSAKPHVIVSDIGMPGTDGYEFIRRVRKLAAAEGGRTPAAALTAFARSEDRRRALMAGFQSHVVKPVEAVELVTVVASLAGRTGEGARR